MPRLLVITTVLLPLFFAGCVDSLAADPAARDAAIWALRRGGTVRVRYVDADGNNVNRQVVDPDTLPAGEFALTEIDLNQIPTNQPPIRDDELTVIADLKNLQVLGLYGSDLTDKGAETIAELRTLQQLELSQTLITDEGLATLATLPNLERLFVRNAGEEVTDDGVAAFRRRSGAEIFR